MKSNNASGGKKPINLGIEAEAMLQGKIFSKIDKITHMKRGFQFLNPPKMSF